MKLKRSEGNSKQFNFIQAIILIFLLVMVILAYKEYREFVTVVAQYSKEELLHYSKYMMIRNHIVNIVMAALLLYCVFKIKQYREIIVTPSVKLVKEYAQLTYGMQLEIEKLKKEIEEYRNKK